MRSYASPIHRSQLSWPHHARTIVKGLLQANARRTLTSPHGSQNFFLGLNVFLSAFGGHGMSLCADPTDCIFHVPTVIFRALGIYNAGVCEG